MKKLGGVQTIGFTNKAVPYHRMLNEVHLK